MKDKCLRLRRLLASYGKLALAFSGGIDSSFLLRCALDALAPEQVLIFFARSPLLKQDEEAMARRWLMEQVDQTRMQLRLMELNFFAHPALRQNPGDRCYQCKRLMYGCFQQEMLRENCAVLIDGVNLDDLEEDRPGLRAIRELQVQTPLALLGFTKAEIRACARERGLANWDKPSASCLATRIPSGMEITMPRLRLIEGCECFLESLGFVGCRVRLERDQADRAQVEIESVQAGALCGALQEQIRQWFRRCGVHTIHFVVSAKKRATF